LARGGNEGEWRVLDECARDVVDGGDDLSDRVRRRLSDNGSELFFIRDDFVETFSQINNSSHGVFP